MKYEYDVMIIGSGPGGYVSAIRAGQFGLKTALIEGHVLGGTCLNRGCIPTKAMLHAGEVLNTIQTANLCGIEVENPQVNLKKLYAYKDSAVKRLRNGINSLLTGNKVDLILGTAAFIDSHTISVTKEETTRTVSAKHVIIATGSKPVIPPIPGLQDAGYWTSTTMLETNPELPERMVIIGGGVIGVESATILQDLGVQVTIIEMAEQLLPRTEPEIARLLKKQLTKSGITIKTGVQVMEVTRTDTGKTCRVQTPSGIQDIEADEILVAVGRTAVFDSVNLKRIGITCERRGITVNSHLQTSIPWIYAIGDVTGSWQLAHAASADGLAAVDHIAGKNHHINRKVIPSCVYTRPEIASVGMTEKEAIEAGYEPAMGTFPMASNGKAMIMGDTSGFVKIITDKISGQILGTHMVGPRATDIIAELAVAMGAELTIEELGSIVHPHPSVSEAVMESAHDVESLAIHMASKRTMNV
ncbi:MAG: dihydrolipoyl dehydrogenase [Spirochaetia bacterium]|nr:dihydrolipoyl dehydrogenase [Spirochaetia bacterium]